MTDGPTSVLKCVQTCALRSAGANCTLASSCGGGGGKGGGKARAALSKPNNPYLAGDISRRQLASSGQIHPSTSTRDLRFHHLPRK